MLKKLFLFSLLIIATFSIPDQSKEEEEKGSGEESGNEKVESENKSKNGSGSNSTGNKKLHPFAKLTKGVNAMDKEFNTFLNNYRRYLIDSDPSLAEKYGAVVNKTADYKSPQKRIDIEELKKQAKEIRMDMRQALQNFKSKKGGEGGKEGDEKTGTESTGGEGSSEKKGDEGDKKEEKEKESDKGDEEKGGEEGDEGDKKEEKGNGSDKGDEGKGGEEGDEGDKKEEKGHGGGSGGDYNDYEIEEIDYRGTSDEEEKKLKELINEG